MACFIQRTREELAKEQRTLFRAPTKRYAAIVMKHEFAALASSFPTFAGKQGISNYGELYMFGGAVNAEIPKRKSRRHSGELGQRFLVSISDGEGVSEGEVGRALLAKTSRFLASNSKCAAQ